MALTPEQFKAQEDQKAALVEELAAKVRGALDPQHDGGDAELVADYKAAQQDLADFRQAYRAQAEVRGERTPGHSLEIEDNADPSADTEV